MASEIRELLKVLGNPKIISFAGGIPDPALLPLDEVRAAYAGVLQSDAQARGALQYSITEGYLPLRIWIRDYMASLGAKVDENDILITNGSQQGLDFVGRLFIEPGDFVVVSTPSYLGALQTFSASGAKFLSVPEDEEGLLMEPLEQALKKQPKFVYLVPDSANPSGVTMSAARRKKLAALAEQYSVPIVEDAAYTWLRYEGDRIDPIISIASQHRGDNTNVIYLGTFSKIIAPALRVGWAVIPRRFADKFVLLKQSSDLHTSTINQIVMANTLSTVFPQHLRKILPEYAARRDCMLAALQKLFPASAKWTKPSGGIFIWVELAYGTDTQQLLQQSLASPLGVAFVPGRAFHADRSGANTLRLSFSTASLEQIETGIAHLGRLLRA